MCRPLLNRQQARAKTTIFRQNVPSGMVSSGVVPGWVSKSEMPAFSKDWHIALNLCHSVKVDAPVLAYIRSPTGRNLDRSIRDFHFGDDVPQAVAIDDVFQHLIGSVAQPFRFLFVRF